MPLRILTRLWCTLVLTFSLIDHFVRRPHFPRKNKQINLFFWNSKLFSPLFPNHKRRIIFMANKPSLFNERDSLFGQKLFIACLCFFISQVINKQENPCFFNRQLSKHVLCTNKTVLTWKSDASSKKSINYLGKFCKNIFVIDMKGQLKQVVHLQKDAFSSSKKMASISSIKTELFGLK